ncbi:hypothetical protein ASPWEDRAFT_110245 [Aspergillus wentii DTO 134E9]|uniref:Zn(2)-C6 fungal-type domain-containing protein n=1 Tax=Aspergillus wentii DTO 134E9 TaxID=1073089 RepID=A0A1L9RJ05_ASPWE|nr:uncharacterized protein ASPWEDRAFT_110245 [Aspergillus wentii DTO 134E9]OJJ34916.1 hypothetical protein ASPWEDRAFT_110245 [Aspergillus wentii DTO 134E9]
MQNSFFRPATSQGQQGVPYDLPPVHSVTSPQSQFHQPPAALLSAPPSRPDSGLRMSHLLQPLPQQMSNPPPPVTTSSYSRSYESSSGSPAEGVSILPDAPPNGSVSGGSGLLHSGGVPQHPAHSQQPLQQKRAYRQRRKDPSCDACRERKVKCDASDSTSCTECTNRKVRCQFTKETNRRMSSIKQVQDLEKQLVTTRQQLQQLRSGSMRSDNIMDLDLDNPSQPLLKLPETSNRPSRRPKAPIVQDLTEVRTNLRNYGRGILKVPPPYRQRGSKPLVTGESPPLPPKDVADRFLGQYFSCIHSVFPVIHWPSFVAEYEELYRAGTLQGVPRDWAAVLFAVFACGSLHTLDRAREEEGKEFVKTACGVMDIWQDDFSLDRARMALIVSIFLYEVNSKSASWVWIGSAVRVAQEIGLHIESGPWPTLEGEMRRRVWWGLYAWDRLLSLEMGKPVLINDQDCDVDLPCPVDDQYILEGGVPEGQQTTPLLSTIHVVRSIGQLTRTLRCSTISPQTLETFERHFNACLATFPVHYHPKSDQYLDPRSLAPIIYLQNARFILHRHNISPFCPYEVRSSALDYCLSTCLDTARLLSRCMQNPPGNGHDWQGLIASSASTMLCTHIWRCALLLLFRQEYAAALVCVQTSAIINDARSVNISCGRYIAFFLNCLLDRLRQNEVVDFERDEEMMAYVSGDMQGTNDGSWIWQGSETGSQLEAVPSNPKSQSEQQAKESESNWESWGWVERTVQYLLSEKQQRQREYERQRENARMAETKFLSPDSAAGNTDEANRRTSSSHSRMTIASII